MVIIFKLIARGGSFSRAAAGFVINQIARDRVEVGGEFVIRFVTLGVFPDADENLLGDVLGVALVAEHFGDRPD